MSWGTYKANALFPKGQKSRVWLIALPVVWLVMVVLGFTLLLKHDTKTTSDVGSALRVSPIEDALVERLGLSENLSHVVVAVHPRCPCTANTLDELQLAMVHADAPAALTFLVYQPESAPESWRGDYFARLRKRFDDATILRDRAGELSKSLDLHSSGAMVVTLGPQVLFRGGITAGRSCRQDNLGALTLREFLDRGAVANSVETPVFGCELDNQSKSSFKAN
ncbi:MAG: hypothetical protein AAGD07_00250 [Planctomycetota bacterium]